MKLIQKPGEEKLITSKQKAFGLNTTIIFCMEISFIEKSSNFLLLGKPGS